MKIALIGATGFIGSKLLDEALSRDQQITALVSRPEKVRSHPNVKAVRVDVQDEAALAEQLKGHDAVISAFSGHAQANTFDYYMQGFRSILAAVKRAEIPRFLVVGGAGSLEVAPGVQLVDTPNFPAQWKQSAEGARQALNLLKQEPQLDWTMLSPAAYIEPGSRTGKYRLGSDQLVVDEQGKSRISLEDYAAAMMDELQGHTYSRRRFTVAY